MENTYAVLKSSRSRDGLRGKWAGESKHANIGISLPGTSEEPGRPYTSTASCTLTLRGDAIVAEFLVFWNVCRATLWRVAADHARPNAISPGRQHLLQLVRMLATKPAD